MSLSVNKNSGLNHGNGNEHDEEVMKKTSMKPSLSLQLGSDIPIVLGTNKQPAYQLGAEMRFPIITINNKGVTLTGGIGFHKTIRSNSFEGYDAEHADKITGTGGYRYYDFASLGIILPGRAAFDSYFGYGEAYLDMKSGFKQDYSKKALASRFQLSLPPGFYVSYATAFGALKENIFTLGVNIGL